jgi:hypothetical protein
VKITIDWGEGDPPFWLGLKLLVDFIDMEDKPLKKMEIINSMFVDTCLTLHGHGSYKSTNCRRNLKLIFLINSAKCPPSQRSQRIFLKRGKIMVAGFRPHRRVGLRVTGKDALNINIYKILN